MISFVTILTFFTLNTFLKFLFSQVKENFEKVDIDEIVF